MIVVSDTTPIISLIKAGCLDILSSLYKNVLIPEAVYQELVQNSAYQEEAEVVKGCSYILTASIQKDSEVATLKNQTGLDIGESEALILYQEQNADLLLIDEHKGRSIARMLDIRFIGTVGILMTAFDQKIMTAIQVKECMDKMIENNIRLSRNLVDKVLEYVGY